MPKVLKVHFSQSFFIGRELVCGARKTRPGWSRAGPCDFGTSSMSGGHPTLWGSRVEETRNCVWEKNRPPLDRPGHRFRQGLSGPQDGLYFHAGTGHLTQEEAILDWDLGAMTGPSQSLVERENKDPRLGSWWIEGRKKGNDGWLGTIVSP